MNFSSTTSNRPHAHQFQFGDSTITTLLEGHVVRNDLHPFVATNATPPTVPQT